VSVTARRKTTTEIERHYFERFRKAYALPAGSVTYRDKPVVTLTGERTIGIEITRFYLQSGHAPHSEQRQRPLRKAVVSEAQGLHRAKGGKRIELTIAFDPARPITSLRRRRLPSELAALAKRVDNSRATPRTPPRGRELTALIMRGPAPEILVACMRGGKDNGFQPTSRLSNPTPRPPERRNSAPQTVFLSRRGDPSGDYHEQTIGPGQDRRRSSWPKAWERTALR
jgi:hypothetical protein